MLEQEYNYCIALTSHAGTAFWAVGNKRTTELDVLKVVAALFTASMFLGEPPDSGWFPICNKNQQLPYQTSVPIVALHLRCCIVFGCEEHQFTDCASFAWPQASTTPMPSSRWCQQSGRSSIGSARQVGCAVLCVGVQILSSLCHACSNAESARRLSTIAHYRFAAAGYYSAFAYAMAQFTVEVPYIIVQSILFSLLVGTV